MTQTTVGTAPLADFIAEQRAQGPLLARHEWSAMQTLDQMRGPFERFLAALDDEERFEYVRLQKNWIDAQRALEDAIRQVSKQFEQGGLDSLRKALNTLTGQTLDPQAARIHTRYLTPSARTRRTAGGNETKVASMTLWEAACMNYDGLTGWSFPGQTGLADASFLDASINASAADFIALVRDLNLGGQLRARLDRELGASASLGRAIMSVAQAEFEFALIEALNDVATSRVDLHKYRQVKRAIAGEVRWDQTQEMHLFVPHGVDSISWTPPAMGLAGQYLAAPTGDSVKIPHCVFSVSGCKGAFSYFPHRPGGALRHYDTHQEACKEFYVTFEAFYKRGEVAWLYPLMTLRDSVRLTQIAKARPRPEGLSPQGKVLYDLVQWLPQTNNVQQIGYLTRTVEKVPVVSLYEFYMLRCRTNVQEMASETPGFMATVSSVFLTVISETLDLLLIPVPGPLKGLGRIRMIAMFAVLGQALIEGGSKALQGEPAELLQGFTDLADLLISSRLHTRLALSARRRHQNLFRQLSEQRVPGTDVDLQRLTDPQLLERMLGTTPTAAREVQAVLETSQIVRPALEKVWAGEAPSASLIEAAQRFTADRLIDWAASASTSGSSPPAAAFHVLGPLLTQLAQWPADTALTIANPLGQVLCRYTKRADRPASKAISVTLLESFLFGYASPRRLTVQLPLAIVALLPSSFAAGEQALRQQLAVQAGSSRLELFEALTRFAGVSRSTAVGAPAAVKQWLPDSVGPDHAVPAVIQALHSLHPHVSLARLVEVLDQHPLSSHQQTQLLHSHLQPEALYLALRAARQVARREAIIDGIFHPRRFDPQTRHWATVFARSVLRDLTGQALVVAEADLPAPYMSKGSADRTVVILDHRQGRVAPFFHREHSIGTMLTGPDGFYQALLSQLSASDLARHGLNGLQAVTQLRARVAALMLRHRSPEGTFYPDRREIAQYASDVDATRIAPEPDAQGIYSLASQQFVFIEGEYFNVARADASLPWRIQHPVLHDAYAPVLAHNGSGAWRHEWEQPLTWDGQKPFYRLGPIARSLSPDAIEQIQRISSVTPSILRRVHVRNEPPPVMLTSTLERFHIHQRVKAGVEVGRDFFDQVLGEIGPDAADVLVGKAGVTRTDQVTVLESKVQIDKPQMEQLFFKALAHKSELSADPLAQVIQRQFPALTALFADDCVQGATPAERQSLQAGRVPASVTAAASWYIRYLRMTRAIEGLHWSAAVNADSSRLILHALIKLPGWPADLRVEVWDADVRIDSVGPAHAPLRRVLKTVTGAYQAYVFRTGQAPRMTGGRGGFLAVLLAALTPAERQSLGYDYEHSAEVLLEEIADRVEHHFGHVETLLGITHQHWFKPPRRLADGRVGYPLSGGEESGPVDREQIARMRELYPSKADEYLWELLLEAGDSVSEREVMVNYLVNERNALDVALQEWRDAASATDNDAASVHPRALAVARIQRCWAKEGFTQGVIEELNLDELGLTSLPTLGAHFGHVQMLSLRSNRLSQLPERFIRAFPHLRIIYFNGNRFVHLPDLEGLSHLAVLNLSNNALAFNLQDEYRLATLAGLRDLDLSGNPLGQGRRLSLYALRSLRQLRLRNAGLTHLPRGAVTLEALRSFDVRDNLIGELAETDLFIYPQVHRAMNLRGNPLSVEARQLLRRIGERPGRPSVDFGLWEPTVAIDQRPDRWLALLSPRQVVARERQWAQLQEQPMASDFFELLGCIANDPRFTDPLFRVQRERVTQRVWALIDDATGHEGVEIIADWRSYNFMIGGIDGWLLCLHELELQMHPLRMLATDLRTAGPGFIHYYRALRRLDELDNLVDEHFSPQPYELRCTRILSYRIALANSLDLPQVLPERFEAPTVLPNADSVNLMRQYILQKEFRVNWPELLQQEPYWVRFIQHKYAVALELTLRRFQGLLEGAEQQLASGLINEGQYVRSLNQVRVARGLAENKRIRKFTLQEWTAFVVG